MNEEEVKSFQFSTQQQKAKLITLTKQENILNTKLKEWALADEVSKENIKIK